MQNDKLQKFRLNFSRCLNRDVAPLKAPANKETLLWKHCCRRKCFPVCACTQHLLRTQKLFLNFFRNILRPQQMFLRLFLGFARQGSKTFVLLPTRLLAMETLRATMFPQQCFLICGGLKTEDFFTENIYLRVQ